MLLAFLVAVTPGLASTQEVSGPLVPAGRLRFEVSSLYLYSDTRFGERMDGGTLVEEEEPLGFDFSDTAAGTRLFPGLEALEQSLATATGESVEPLILGSTRAVVTHDAVFLPLRIDIGIFDWLSVGGMVPFSRRRAEVAWAFDGNGANAGVTPSVSDPSAVGVFLGGLAVAEAALSSLADERCSVDPTASDCVQASSLLDDGRQFRQALLGALASQGVFPMDGTPTAAALQTRVQSLMSAHQTLGVSYPANVPMATQLLSEEDYGGLVTNPGYGVVGVPFESWRSAWEMGDVELFANVRLWASGPTDETDETGESGESVEPRSGPTFLVGAGGLVRLGTGKTDLSENFFDTGSGDGQQDLELSLWGGITSGRLGIWGEARYGVAAATVVARRIGAPDRIFAPLTSTQSVRWTPGNYYHLRLTPRFHLTEEMAIAFDVRAYSKKADTYESIVADDVPFPFDVGLLELETERNVLETGVGVVYSTVRSGRGRPMEARFLFRRAVSGNGGLTPKTERFEFGLRLFKGIWKSPP
jgi:hypothetical protein